MKIKYAVKTVIDKRIANLQKAIISAKIARDMAPSAMESHTDTTRGEKEKLITVLESELNKLETLGKRELKLRIYEVNLGQEKAKFALVPEGLGGESFDGIKLVSLSSPLGKVLIGKKLGDEFNFINLKGKVIGLIEV